MAPKDEKNQYDDDFLTEARQLAWDESALSDGEDFSLEEILAEYGGGTERKILRDAERETVLRSTGGKPVEKAAEQVPADERTISLPNLKGKRSAASGTAPAEARKETKPAEKRSAAPKPTQAPEKDLLADLPKPPRPVTLEDVVGRTVDAVKEEQSMELLPERRHRRGLFSRKALPPEDTEELYQRPEAPPEPEPEADEPIGPEEPLEDAAVEARRREKRRQKFLPLAFSVTVLLGTVLALDQRDYVIPFWTGNVQFQTLAQLAVLLLVSLCCRDVFARGFSLVARHRWPGELLASLAAIVTAADCAARLLLPGRTDAMPYALTACAALAFAQWGLAKSDRALFDTYRAAAISDAPPYLVTNTPQGACKQRGRVEGFYTDSIQDDFSLLWQTAFVPVILMGTVVFAGLSSLGQGKKADFLLCWSAILSASSSLALPLAWSLPWSRLAKHLQKNGCAVAGWAGAEAISRKKAMILTDLDLFPPGSVRLNGIKVFGEELPHAASYAASLVRASGSGLTRLFDDLIRGEGGRYYKLDDFSFYEEGGCSATIRGESVLLGTASFMRKMNVRLPGNINLRTGLFLSIDRQLAAVFAVKYSAAENVDWALRLMKRNHITPILASRDPNITPALMKRKFSKGVRLEYPPLAARLALSEQEGGSGRPRALLLREGLLPYAETVVGSRRLRCGVRNGTILSLLGSAAGTLLSFYLVFQGSFSLIAPVTLLVFLLLWVVPVLLLSGWAGWE